jgi:hypothetical protein
MQLEQVAARKPKPFGRFQTAATREGQTRVGPALERAPRSDPTWVTVAVGECPGLSSDPGSLLGATFTVHGILSNQPEGTLFPLTFHANQASLHQFVATQAVQKCLALRTAVDLQRCTHRKVSRIAPALVYTSGEMYFGMQFDVQVTGSKEGNRLTFQNTIATFAYRD